jgi:hypothetical protein
MACGSSRGVATRRPVRSPVSARLPVWVQTPSEKRTTENPTRHWSASQIGMPARPPSPPARMFAATVWLLTSSSLLSLICLARVLRAAPEKAPSGGTCRAAQRWVIGRGASPQVAQVGEYLVKEAPTRAPDRRTSRVRLSCRLPSWQLGQRPQPSRRRLGSSDFCRHGRQYRVSAHERSRHLEEP